ncbi:UDP-Gal or UDP-GlcNAc-dependent glycosyltransferase [Trypanosoma grayi]|uniref:UDP-Gal or UDP-GlcNAc-dependent glycosyltransferase n=1 Tax=Trypanosoma grayi TaxID=71804 RepID=UPI0004F44DFA|nr:UDP-Gal or UDP-GlcNAc-dependent glycosyltransferase [Trypanosoma grayi]KEG07878.1 UDP-Gal or UDP-GlcNAc-dependent glycosyltransferase [Trypanosoma grayi]
MDHEDNMVGRVLHEVKYPRLIFAKERKCRFHNLRNGPFTGPVSNLSVMVHHIKEEEYGKLMHRFGMVANASAKLYKRVGNVIEFGC